MNSVRIDDIGFGGLRLAQDPDDFCYGIDAVLLAAHAASCVSAQGGAVSGSGLKIADLGTGNGIVPLILSHKLAESSICGIEMDGKRAALAARNAEMNGLTDRISIIESDILDIESELYESFDLVTMNPPYVRAGSGMKNPDPAKAGKMTARHETTAGIEEFLASAYRLLRPKGEAVLVHRPSRLTDIMAAARSCRMEPKELRLIRPFEGKEPNICLVRMAKDGGPELKVLPDLVVREADGSYTKEINIIYER